MNEIWRLEIMNLRAVIDILSNYQHQKKLKHRIGQAREIGQGMVSTLYIYIYIYIYIYVDTDTQRAAKKFRFYLGENI